MRGAATALTVVLQLVTLLSLYKAADSQSGASTSAGVYAGQQPDSCGYGVIAPSISPHLASFSKSSPLLAPLPSSGCGACVQGVCSAAPTPLTVKIVDTSSVEIQLSAADMDTVSPQGNRLGHVDVSLQQVDCPVSGNILVRLQQLAPMAGGYAKLALLNVAGSNGITAVGLAPAGTQTFAPLKNSYGAVWEGSLPAAPPLDMQVASGGQTLLVRGIITGSTTPGDITSTVQFTATGLGNAATAGHTPSLIRFPALLVN
ncbi:hypothetical protein ABBQ32_013298 [Trebouxia sp. C0010 RCD-2024]